MLIKLILGFLITFNSTFASELITKLYTWRDHTLCGEFSKQSGAWIQQVSIDNCGGSYFQFYFIEGRKICGEFTKTSDAWIDDASKTKCIPARSSGGITYRRSGEYASGPNECENGANCGESNGMGYCYCN